MVQEDLKTARRMALLKEHNVELPLSVEYQVDLMKKIFGAGHNGMVGSSICRKLQLQPNVEVILRTRKELDLCNQSAVHKFM